MNYEISLKERNGVLYAHYYEGGKLFRKSLKLKATKPNIAYAQKQIIPNLQLKLAGGKKLFVKTSVSEFFERILDREQNQGDSTLNSYKVGFRRFLEYFGDRSIESFTILELDNFIAHLSKTLKPSTVKTYLTPISLMFNEAIRLDIVGKNPVTFALKPIVRIEKRKSYTITQLHRLLDEARGDLKTFLYFGFFTGMRSGEILALDWSDIDFKDKTVSISKNKTQFGIGLPKNKKTRVIPLINKLAEYLAPIKKDKGLIFDTYYLAINRQMRALCERLGFFFEGLHNTRHTFASLMLQAKENPLLVVRFLGHADMTMLNKVYAHYLEDIDDCNRFSTLLTHTA